uniref:3-hydroxyisobutyryl-CoA hydrolase n=1 Tax=Rhizophora mucronata TaxID=61149 RepID=A0A2P2JWP0_RHIMU
MQGLKAAAAVLTRRRSKADWLLFYAYYRRQCRPLCSRPSSHYVDDEDVVESQVLVEGKAHSRTAILNKPSVLNALSTQMGTKLMKLYKSWEDDPDIGFVTMKVKFVSFLLAGL